MKVSKAQESERNDDIVKDCCLSDTLLKNGGS